jgi:hypothetical protein
MPKILTTCLLTLLGLAWSSRADLAPDAIFRPAPGVRSDRAAGIGKRVQPGGTLVLADLRGPAVIRHFWMTNVRQVEAAVRSGRVAFRFYWDDHRAPDLEIPLSEFFGTRFTESPDLVFPMALGKNAYYTMAFQHAAKVELKNDSDVELWGIYWQIDYDRVDRLPERAEHFTAHTKAAPPAALGPQSGIVVPHTGAQAIPAVGKIVLADLTGPAVIRRIRISYEREPAGDPVLINRGVIVRIFWDGTPQPSVEAPLGDFFGVGFGEERDFRSAAWAQSEGWREILFPMPFKRSARIELVNLASRAAGRFSWTIDYEKRPDGAGEIECLHANFRLSRPVPLNSTHVALETSGSGKFVGLVWSCHWLNDEQKPEGTQNFHVDGKRIQSTGSEDYFGRAWGFGSEPDCRSYKGISLGPEKSASAAVPAEWQRVTAYRAHVPDPIHFQQSLKFDFTCYGYNRGHRTDEYATVCFWYQSTPASLAALPPLEDLLPIDHPDSFAFGLHQIARVESQRDLATALRQIESLRQRYPQNPKAADLWFKSGCVLEELGQLAKAREVFRQIRQAHAGMELGEDANDKIWLLERPGRLLVKAGAPAGSEIHVDGRKVALPLARGIPSWGQAEIFRFTYPPFKVVWDSPSSAIMRLPSTRLDLGPGRHVIAVKASAAQSEPIFTPRVGYFFAALDLAGPDIVTDATWRLSEREEDGWTRADFDDRHWPAATMHPLAKFGDGAWTWLWPRGFRNFSGSMHRIWTPAIFREDKAFRETVYFRKHFDVR